MHANAGCVSALEEEELEGLGRRVWSLGIMNYGLGFGVWGLGLRVEG